MFGYQANVEQTERSLFGIKLAFAGAPLAAAVLVVILLQFYKLKKGWEQKEAMIGRPAAVAGNL
jgi:Na+/melibiose symporter-like transporter